MRISDWRSDVCSSDLRRIRHRAEAETDIVGVLRALEIELIDESRRASLCARLGLLDLPAPAARGGDDAVEQVERRGLRVTRAELANDPFRSEEHTSELQSLMRISYAVFCLKKKKYNTQ